MIKEFKLPDLGENIDAADVVKVLVSVGDTISKDQSVLEVETDKAAIEVPSTVKGVIKEIRIKEGDKAKVGQVILTVEDSSTAPAEEEKPIEKAEGQAPQSAPKPVSKPPEITPSRVEAPKPPPKPIPALHRPQKLVPAAPTVRRFAREIGIDITKVPGTGPGGRISIKDVKNYSRQLRTRTVDDGGRAFPQIQLPDFSKWGEIEKEAMSNVRRKTAEQMSLAWTIPHVVQYDKADITALNEIRKQFGPAAEKAGAKLTFTAILLKVVAEALKRFPKFNASIDTANNEVIYKKYYHVGVAVDTDRGLLVPVIRDADRKNIKTLAVELNEMAEKARTKKISPDDMQGGTFTITNLGGMGVTAFAPIINTPEVAILGVAKGHVEPVWDGKEFQPRLILPLSISYDHRIIDGADAARFLRWICEALEQPFMLIFD